MASTLETCANAAARPASPAAGDTLYQIDSQQIITWDGSAWRVYNSDGSVGYDLDGTNSLSDSPVLHFDAEFFNGVDTSGNPSNDTSIDTSTVWKSRVDSSITLSQHVAASQPLYKTSGTNSKPYVYCDGGDYLYFSKGFALPGEFTTFAIAEQSNSIPPTIFGGSGVNIGFTPRNLSANANLAFGFASNTYYLYYQESGAANGTAPLPGSTDMRALLISRDGSNNTKLFMDGDNEGSAVGTNSETQFIGQVFHGKGAHYDHIGNVYELMLFKTSLSNADRNALGAYAQAKYGSGNLGWTNF